ncbi:hypothetical protein LEP1GSC103_3435 [Leptospira borgpetersenii serovar Javanica str. UI 09931]|uniref:Uncharacterized protein n=1 Tax=Leptospira borgpetersenii serovar Javanica str. UI 09931 TaxID=1049767 RepID=A0AAV3JIY5_LEPBO|nr:hypothetical protein LEP1GSC101_3574 [Leptospira borgpetersenii str. UI 09149]EKQ98367.1 hypothetical protein LEP1GSC121_3062 [Leptospira borgpetersenii serovar Castellonis str. 200801910]EMN11278.1 hypothetical protein LEP1GSC055_2888 [Leptospira borgpetersenii str. Brem 307]EPG59229.1 hypothetical protein LEP1GSC103_3435 [Leptospira borgpetersenii serovar Javanica str. UI 09931]
MSISLETNAEKKDTPERQKKEKDASFKTRLNLRNSLFSS